MCCKRNRNERISRARKSCVQNCGLCPSNEEKGLLRGFVFTKGRGNFLSLCSILVRRTYSANNVMVITRRSTTRTRQISRERISPASDCVVETVVWEEIWSETVVEDMPVTG